MAIILKIDKPKSCADCILTYAKVCPLTNNSVVKDIINDTLSKDCPLKSADDYKSVLDKIRTEIKAMGGDIETIADVLAIIDKYKAETEVKDGNDD